MLGVQKFLTLRGILILVAVSFSSRIFVWPPLPLCTTIKEDSKTKTRAEELRGRVTEENFKKQSFEKHNKRTIQ